MTLETAPQGVPNNIIPFPPILGNDQNSKLIVDVSRDESGPIEQKMRAVLAKLRNSTYHDTFDWSVYDKIAKKLESRPNGGVVFNTTFKLGNWHPICSKCHYMFELDTYGRGCLHDCVYCYAKDQLTSHGYWNRPQPFPINLAEIRKLFYTVFETDKANKWREILEQRIPLRIGSMSDPFLWLDTKYHVTKEVLKILTHYRYPSLMFTRSDLAAHDDYIEVMDPKLCSIQYSISGDNWSLLRRIEPGAPSYRRRLKAIRKLSDHGFRTAVRVNPLLPKYPDGYFSDPKYIHERFGTNVPSVDFYTDSFVSDIASAGADTLILGFMRLNGKATKAMSTLVGVDYRSFFRPSLAPKSGNADGHYTSGEIRHYYNYFSEMATKAKIRFTTCYIGNGIDDYYVHQDLWSNKSDCCDLVGSLKSFVKTSQNISWDKRISHAPYKSIASEAEKIEQRHNSGASRLKPPFPNRALDQTLN
jgi:DNA repair photolyase